MTLTAFTRKPEALVATEFIAVSIDHPVLHQTPSEIQDRISSFKHTEHKTNAFYGFES